MKDLNPCRTVSLRQWRGATFSCLQPANLEQVLTRNDKLLNGGSSNMDEGTNFALIHIPATPSVDPATSAVPSQVHIAAYTLI